MVTRFLLIQNFLVDKRNEDKKEKKNMFNSDLYYLYQFNDVDSVN